MFAINTVYCHIGLYPCCKYTQHITFEAIGRLPLQAVSGSSVDQETG